jgi:glycosyltransferase involved in cell wall biosynthesis
MTPLRIAYLLADTEIAGGIRVAVAHADILTTRGHEVTLVTKGGPLTWRKSRANWMHVQSFDEIRSSAFDFVVGTFWTTIEEAYRLAGPRAVHFCQGYEGSFTAYQHLKPHIDAAYRLPVPKITVSPHLVPICREFHDDATYVGQIVDDEFFQPHRDRTGSRPRVLLVGPWQADFKGIDVGYAAVEAARNAGAEFDLIRVSQWAAPQEEPVHLAAEFHVGVTTSAMLELYATGDVLLGPSRSVEGFGLPAAEAMAGGVPTVLSEIPSFLSWSNRRDHALFAPEGDGVAFGAQLLKMLNDEPLRARLAQRGHAVAGQFRAPATGERLESWLVGRGSARTRTSGR